MLHAAKPVAAGAARARSQGRGLRARGSKPSSVSLNTMRTHTKNIYAKLAVTNRRAAVRRAAELDLLPRTRSPRS